MAKSSNDAAMLEEWTDYLEEMVDAIDRGYFDNILNEMIESLQQRQDFVATRTKVARRKVRESEVVTTADSIYNLVGKVVRINKMTRPTWAQGCLVRVLDINTTTCNVEWAEDVSRRSTSRLAQAPKFRLSNSSIDVVFKNAPVTRTSRRRSRYYSSESEYA
jgi:hypothetical protein